MKAPRALAVVAALAFAWTVQAAEPVRITGLYSDMVHHETEGDFVGLEVFIVPSMDAGRTSYHALVQFAEGTPEPPQLVDVAVDGRSVRFTARYLGTQDVHFEGAVTSDSLIGEIPEIGANVTLERRMSVWQ